MAKLVLIRHGKSEWNELGLWTGWKDIDLNQQGEIDAEKAGQAIKDIKFDLAFTSKLIRAKHTLDIVLETINQTNLEIKEDAALNERNYGIYTGKNKWQVKEQVGEEEFQKIRRGWDHPIPDGENAEVVYTRVVKYYTENILPNLKMGKNVIIAAHGNSLRALVKHLEDLSIEDFMKLEFGIGEAYVYEIDDQGNILSKDIRAKNEMAGKV